MDDSFETLSRGHVLVGLLEAMAEAVTLDDLNMGSIMATCIGNLVGAAGASGGGSGGGYGSNPITGMPNGYAYGSGGGGGGAGVSPSVPQYPYPGGIWAPTKPKDKEMHIIFDNNGSAKFIYQWDDASGNWIDVTSAPTPPQPVPAGFVPCDGRTLEFELSPHIVLELGPQCECGNKQNPIGQGHSHWCARFQQEF